MPAADVQFDEASHTYRVGGQVWPGVSRVLEQLQILDGVPLHYLEAAAKFGRHVHEACHLDNVGALDWRTLDTALEPYVRAWHKFLTDTRAVVIASEQIVVNTKARYCGRLDTICRINQQRELVDIKSTAVIPYTVGPQTAAYAHAYGEPRIRRRVVQLRGDGTYRSERLNDAADWPNFLSALNVHNWRSRYASSRQLDAA